MKQMETKQNKSLGKQVVAGSIHGEDIWFAGSRQVLAADQWTDFCRAHPLPSFFMLALSLTQVA